MPDARPGITISFDAETQPHCTIVKGASIRLWDDGEGSGPGGDNTISLTDYHEVTGSLTLIQLCHAIENDCPAFSAEVHGDAANYCLAVWLESVTDVQWSPGGSHDFEMTTEFVAKNPTLPSAADVKNGTDYGDGGDELTGTLVLPRRSC